MGFENTNELLETVKKNMYLTVCRNYANKVNYVLVIFSMLKWMRISPFYMTNVIHLLQWISNLVSFCRRIPTKRTKQLSFSLSYYLHEWLWMAFNFNLIVFAEEILYWGKKILNVVLGLTYSNAFYAVQLFKDVNVKLDQFSKHCLNISLWQK